MRTAPVFGVGSTRHLSQCVDKPPVLLEREDLARSGLSAAARVFANEFERLIFVSGAVPTVSPWHLLVLALLLIAAALATRRMWARTG